MGEKITSICRYLIDKGFDERTVVRAVLCGVNDVAATDEVCVAILADIEKRRELEADGETHLVSRGIALPDSLINVFVNEALLIFNKFGPTIPKELLELIKIQLHIVDPDYEQEARYTVCAYLVSRHPDASNRKIAEVVECDHTTIRRWREESEFLRSLEVWKDIDSSRVRDTPKFQPYLKRIDEFFEQTSMRK